MKKNDSILTNSYENVCVEELSSSTRVDMSTDDGGGGSGGSLSCFPAGTKILLPDWTSKSIEHVRNGDMVMGHDGFKPIAVIVEAIEAPLRDHFYYLTFDNDTFVKLTSEHPLFTNEGWKSLSPENTIKENTNLIVGTLKLGDYVLTSDEKYCKLVEIKFVSGQVKTYNLKKLSHGQQFYANGFLVHNKA
jgi:hypothetical protein